MKALIVFVIFIFLYLAAAFGWWAASQHHKPEVEELELSRHGPERDCGEFVGDPEAYAKCFGYQ